MNISPNVDTFLVAGSCWDESLETLDRTLPTIVLSSYTSQLSDDDNVGPDRSENTKVLKS